MNTTSYDKLNDQANTRGAQRKDNYKLKEVSKKQYDA